MKCSECSNVVKPVVALDIDGTLGDYHEAFKSFCGRYFNRPVPETPWDGTGEFEDFIGVTKTEYREAKLAYRQGGNKRWMPCYVHSATVARHIREAGAELWVATSRPWQRLDNIDPDTRFWLDRNGMEVDGLLYGEDKYMQLLQAVDKDRIIAVVDDLPEQLMVANRLGLPAIMRHQPHNQWALHTMPGGDLPDILDMILVRIQEWSSNA